jgi:hypothetical protein
MTEYVRIETDYNVVNLDNIDSRVVGNPVSYINLHNIPCGEDVSGELFETFGKFSKYFVCEEHLSNNYITSPDYVANPGCIRCTGVQDAAAVNNSKIIDKSVRQHSSSRTDVFKTRSAKDKLGCNTKWSWHNQSSKSQAGVVSKNVPSRGNSTKSTLTRHRPGAASAPGLGVDVKHGSYERYLLRKKSKSLAC